MPISVTVVDDRYTVLRCEGEICVDDFLKANDYLYSELDETLSQYQILDTARPTNIELSEEDLRKIAGQDKLAARTLKRVFIAVVATEDFAFGLSRMWAVYADDPRVKTSVFRELEAAQDWILSMQEKAT